MAVVVVQRREFHDVGQHGYNKRGSFSGTYLSASSSKPYVGGGWIISAEEKSPFSSILSETTARQATAVLLPCLLLHGSPDKYERLTCFGDTN